MPVTKYGFCTSAEQARQVAEEISGPCVIKSQVLSGGRMKAGGVKFADTPEEAAATPRTSSRLEINDHMPRGVLVGHKAGGQAGVLREHRLGQDREAAR
ncbi:MAG: ATP-grasp domain-containing protein [Solirubrobacterales bacterium]